MGDSLSAPLVSLMALQPVVDQNLFRPCLLYSIEQLFLTHMSFPSVLESFGFFVKFLYFQFQLQVRM